MRNGFPLLPIFPIRDINGIPSACKLILFFANAELYSPPFGPTIFPTHFQTLSLFEIAVTEPLAFILIHWPAFIYIPVSVQGWVAGIIIVELVMVGETKCLEYGPTMGVIITRRQVHTITMGCIPGNDNFLDSRMAK